MAISEMHTTPVSVDYEELFPDVAYRSGRHLPYLTPEMIYAPIIAPHSNDYTIQSIVHLAKHYHFKLGMLNSPIGTFSDAGSGFLTAMKLRKFEKKATRQGIGRQGLSVDRSFKLVKELLSRGIVTSNRVIELDIFVRDSLKKHNQQRAAMGLAEATCVMSPKISENDLRDYQAVAMGA